MPGPAKWRTPYLVQHCLASRKLSERDLDEGAFKVLQWAQRLARMSPETVYGDDIEVTMDRPEDRELVQAIGARACVLLKNDGTLPLKAEKAKRIAVIGPRAIDRTVFGGGSAQINTSFTITVLDGMKAACPEGAEVVYALGTTSHKMLPYLDGIVRDDGCPGTDLRLYTSLANSPSVHHYHLPASHVLLNDGVPAILEGSNWYGVMSGKWTAPITGAYQFSISVCGRAKLFVDGKLVVDNWDVLQTPGETFFGQGTTEEFGTHDVVEGQTYNIRVEYSNVPGVLRQRAGDTSSQQTGEIVNFGVRVGGFPVVDLDAEMERAVELARNVDAVVLAVGLSPDWESESYDRPTLALPMRTNELVEKVAKANPKTVVAVQAGSAVSMPWVDDVAAVVHAWYGGNASGAALADVLYGRVNPSGRLPMSFPVREEDIAAHGNFRSVNGELPVVV